jgi:hypothetical protein
MNAQNPAFTLLDQLVTLRVQKYTFCWKYQAI